MKTIALTRRPINAKELFKKTALATDTEIEYSEPAIFTLDGEPIIFYGMCDFDTAPARQACRTISYHGGERSSGLKSYSRIFGAMPRDPLRRDYTGLGTLGDSHKEQTSTLYDVAARFDSLYKSLAPAIYDRHKENVSKILPCWRMRETIFTSGIVNNSNSLKYHYDRGNFKGALSCMLTLRRHIDGGSLSIPEFNIRLALLDSSYLLFDGQSILHGVTPIEKLTREAYRYTTVYYSLEALMKAKTPDEELAACRRRATEKYTKRAALSGEQKS